MQEGKEKLAAQVYETKSGLRFWMDLKGAIFAAKARIIRTSDPDTSIVIVPDNMSQEDVYLFLYKGKRFAFVKPSDISRLHSDIIDQVAARNPELDMIFTHVGRPQVDWYDPFAKIEGENFFAKRFTLDADTDLGSGFITRTRRQRRERRQTGTLSGICHSGLRCAASL